VGAIAASGQKDGPLQRGIKGNRARSVRDGTWYLANDRKYGRIARRNASTSQTSTSFLLIYLVVFLPLHCFGEIVADSAVERGTRISNAARWRTRAPMSFWQQYAVHGVHLAALFCPGSDVVEIVATGTKNEKSKSTAIKLLRFSPTPQLSKTCPQLISRRQPRQIRARTRDSRLSFSKGAAINALSV